MINIAWCELVYRKTLLGWDRLSFLILFHREQAVKMHHFR